MFLVSLTFGSLGPSLRPVRKWVGYFLLVLTFLERESWWLVFVCVTLMETRPGRVSVVKINIFT